MGLFRIFILLLELKKKIDIRIAYENLSGSVIFSNIKHIFENIQELVPCYQVTWKIVHQLVYTWKLLFERLEDIQEKNADIKSMKHIYLFIYLYFFQMKEESNHLFYLVAKPKLGCFIVSIDF